MRVLIYPADEEGCGKIRLIWPAQMLAEQGHDVVVEDANRRKLRMHVDEQTGQIDDVGVDEDVEVIVMQRPSHPLLAQAIPIIRSKGVAVVVDVDDDMSSIHPENVAWLYVHPERAKQELIAQGWRNQPGMPRLNYMADNLTQARHYVHSYKNLETACREASLVTCSTPRLARIYARHGRGRVLYNCLADHYFGHERIDSADIAWPASIHSHPNDPPVMGGALARVLRETGVGFSYFGEHEIDMPGRRRITVRERFSLDHDPSHAGQIPVDEWAAALARIGIAIIPLADTTFNYSKSWLKGMECSAAGVPWVASPRVEYRRLHGQGCGLLADKPADWHRLLRELIRSPIERDVLAEAGRTVAEQWRLRDKAFLWWEAWTDALAFERGRAGAHPERAAAPGAPGLHAAES